MADPRAILSVSGPDLPTDQIQVGKGKFTIGRVPENNLPLNNQKVSRRHADIFWEDNSFVIEDLESSNGTIVNGNRIDPRKPTPITLNDVITIGPFTLTVTSIDGGESAPPPKPVQVLTPEPAAPIPAAAPPVGAPPADEAPAVYVSAPPVSPQEAPTMEPQRTTPAEKQKDARDDKDAKNGADGLTAKDGKDGHAAAPAKEDKAAAKKDGTPAGGHAVAEADKARPIDAAMMVPPPPRPPSTNGRRAYTLMRAPIEGVPADESRYMQYLPGVYHDSDFLKRYLLIMESILAPFEWGIDSFEQYYNPNVTTPDWLQWIGFWFDIFIHPSIPVERQRAVVRELASLYRARGTRRALIRLLELYFGSVPEIIEQDDPPSSFKVKLKLAKEDNTPLNKALAEQLITICKPAYTSFTLEIR